MLRASTVLMPLYSKAMAKEAILAMLATGKGRAKRSETGLVVLGGETDARGLLEMLEKQQNLVTSL